LLHLGALRGQRVVVVGSRNQRFEQQRRLLIGGGGRVQLLGAHPVLGGHSLERRVSAGARLFVVGEFLNERFHLRALVGVLGQLTQQVLIAGHQGVQLAFAQALRPVDQGNHHGALQQLPFGGCGRLARFEHHQNAVVGGHHDGGDFGAIRGGEFEMRGAPDQPRAGRDGGHRFQGQRRALRKGADGELKSSQAGAPRAS
jgi:hypothetical protein